MDVGHSLVPGEAAVARKGGDLARVCEKGAAAADEADGDDNGEEGKRCGFAEVVKDYGEQWISAGGKKILRTPSWCA